jgi:hypothetical protein
MGATVDFANDMVDNLHDNNGAFSQDGEVFRLNGAYDNNAATKSGPVNRINGAYDNNAVSDSGDVRRVNGVVFEVPTLRPKHANLLQESDREVATTAPARNTALFL